LFFCFCRFLLVLLCLRLVLLFSRYSAAPRRCLYEPPALSAPPPIQNRPTHRS
jgi:hypothetical protein